MVDIFYMTTTFFGVNVIFFLFGNYVDNILYWLRYIQVPQ